MDKLKMQPIGKALIILFLMIGGSYLSAGQGYKLEWNGQSVNFSAVSGLDGTTQTTLLRNRTLSGTQTPIPKILTLQKVQCNTESEIYRWFCSFTQTTGIKTDVKIKLTNQYGATIKSWKVTQASPKSMYTSQPMNAKGGEVSIDTFRLSYEKIEPVW
jgi:phage tail-like protein